MTSLAKTIASFSRAERILAVLFGLGFVLGFLLAPLGGETRINELRTWGCGGVFITTVLFLPLAGLVSLFIRKAKLAGVLAVIDASFSFLIPPADQAKFFFTVSPPPAVFVCEYILILVGIGYMLYGPRVYSQTR